jgi:hypothetical protein
MSHKPFASENATPEEMREKLDKFFAHVQQHDPKSLKFALMVAGHGEANGNTHVCSMIGGTPQTLAYIITELMDELVKHDPTIAAFFIINFLQRAKANTGDADIKEMLNKIRSVH